MEAACGFFFLGPLKVEIYIPMSPIKTQTQEQRKKWSEQGRERLEVPLL
jgi:hypothetical protein